MTKHPQGIKKRLFHYPGLVERAKEVRVRPTIKITHEKFGKTFGRLNPENKTKLMRSLGTAGRNEFIHSLKGIIINVREEKFVRILAAKALQRVGTAEAVKALEEAHLEINMKHHSPSENIDLSHNITQSIHELSRKLRSSDRKVPDFIK